MRRLFQPGMFTAERMQIVWQQLLPIWCVAILLLMAPFGSIRRDLWTDEAFTASYTSYPTIGALLDDVRKNEETPPISFVLTWLWAQIAGTSEVALRAFAMLWGILAVLLFARLAVQWLPVLDAWVAGTLVALAPLTASYLVEARGYTLTLFLSIVCMAVFERLYRDPERRVLYLLYALAAAALFLTSYFGVALLLAHNLIWLLLLLRDRVRQRGRLLDWCGAQLLVGLLVLLWLPSLLYQMQVASAVTSFWGNGLWDYYLLTFSLLMNVPPNSALLALWIPLVALSWGLIVLALLYARRQDQGIAVRIFWVPALMLALLIVWMQVVAPRYLIVLLGGGALAAAQGARVLRTRWPRAGAAVVVALLVGLLAYRLPTTLNATAVRPWSALVDEVERQADPARDVVLFHPPWDQRIFEYYYHGPALPLLGVHNYDDFYYDDRSHDLRTTWTSAQALAATRGKQRVWVFYDQMFHTVPRLQLPYIEQGHWKNDRLELFLYEVPAGQ